MAFEIKFFPELNFSKVTCSGNVYFEGRVFEGMQVNWKGDSRQKYNVPAETGNIYG